MRIVSECKVLYDSFPFYYSCAIFNKARRGGSQHPHHTTVTVIRYTSYRALDGETQVKHFVMQGIERAPLSEVVVCLYCVWVCVIL